MLADDDPCLVSNMTESILPLIPERSGGKSHSQGTQVNTSTAHSTDKSKLKVHPKISIRSSSKCQLDTAQGIK